MWEARIGLVLENLKRRRPHRSALVMSALYQRVGSGVRVGRAARVRAAGELQQRDAATTFVAGQVVIDDQLASSTPIEIILAGGRSVRITPGFDPATLRQLLAVLQEVPPC
jgi:hypothetical protein